MNRIKNIFCAVILSAFTVSCVNLDYTEVTTADEEWIYKSPMYGIQKLVYNIYARVPNGFEKTTRAVEGLRWRLPPMRQSAHCLTLQFTVSTTVDGILTIPSHLRGAIRMRLSPKRTPSMRSAIKSIWTSIRTTWTSKL